MSPYDPHISVKKNKIKHIVFQFSFFEWLLNLSRETKTFFSLFFFVPQFFFPLILLSVTFNTHTQWVGSFDPKDTE